MQIDGQIRQGRERSVTDAMCLALRELQTVRAFDYSGAYRAAFGGISVLDPRNVIHAGMIRGQILAFQVWRERCADTLAARPS